MKKTLSTMAAAALLSGMLALPVASFAQTAAPPATGQQQRQAPNQQARERHPEIRRALKKLREARTNLQKGSHDFGGHRAQALQLVDQAIQQCEQALQADKH